MHKIRALLLAPLLSLPLLALSSAQYLPHKPRLACDVPLAPTITAPLNDPALIQRGAYLAIAGDCEACHTNKNGQPYAGGLPLPIPMLGNIYASNITPDPETGIGTWTLAEFDRAVRHGVSKDGSHLYPAMPYVSYAKIRDEDIMALYAYFKNGVPAIKQHLPKSTIHWPLSMRWPLAFWNMLFAPSKPYAADPTQTAAWNRGAYLVQGLAHCGTCHTPRGLFMQEKALDATHKHFMAGASLAGWEAYNITADPAAGIGAWTPAQLYVYLRTGNVPNLAQAGGPMAEAVQHSFSKLSDSDIGAMVTYIQSVPAVRDGSHISRAAWGAPSQAELQSRGQTPIAASDPATLYLGACASCHQANGLGSTDHYYPSLVHNSTVGAKNPNNLIQVILHGVQRKTAELDIGMPAFKDDLSDAQIAALTNYLTRQFGNPNAKQVTERDVKKLRTKDS
jgi:mono/diheme cytochrome c family protein